MNIPSPTPSTSGFIQKLITWLKNASPFRKWVSLFALVVTTMILGIANIAEILPNELQWIKPHVIELSFVISMVTTFLYYSLLRIIRYLAPGAPGGLVSPSLSGAAALIALVFVLYVVFTRTAQLGGGQEVEFLTPNPSQIQQTLIAQFAPLGLSPVQRQQIEEILKNQQFLTEADMDRVGLSELQRREINGVFATMGVVTFQDLTQIASTVVANNAALTAAAVLIPTETLEPCLIEPNVGLGDVALRLRANTNTVQVAALYRDLNDHFSYDPPPIQAIGRSSDSLADNWWLVSLPNVSSVVMNGYDGVTEAWVSAMVVTPLSYNPCLMLPRIPGAR